jgi:hypothetical protein
MDSKNSCAKWRSDPPAEQGVGADKNTIGIITAKKLLKQRIKGQSSRIQDYL